MIESNDEYTGYDLEAALRPSCYLDDVYDLSEGAPGTDDCENLYTLPA